MAGPRSIYFGTFEADYPRNRQLIRELRAAGDVRVLHAPLLDDQEHKTGLVRSPRALLSLGRRAGAAYAQLLRRLWREGSDAEEIMAGYIGHLDVLAAWPLARLRRQRLRFNPLISLHDTLVTDRGLFDVHSPPARALWALDWLAFHAVDELLIDTHAHRDFLIREFGLDPERVRVRFVSADPIFRPVEVPRRPQDAGRFVVLFYGKLIPLHGLDKVLQAMALLEARGERRIWLRIIGSGQLEAPLRQLAQKLALQRYDWTPWLPYEDLPHAICQSDLCLGVFGDSAKAARVIPNKVWQALACGRPVLSRRLAMPEHHSLLQGLTQIEATPEAIADALQARAQKADSSRNSATLRSTTSSS